MNMNVLPNLRTAIFINPQLQRRIQVEPWRYGDAQYHKQPYIPIWTIPIATVHVCNSGNHIFDGEPNT